MKDEIWACQVKRKRQKHYHTVWSGVSPRKKLAEREAKWWRNEGYDARVVRYLPDWVAP